MTMRFSKWAAEGNVHVITQQRNFTMIPGITLAMRLIPVRWSDFRCNNSLYSTFVAVFLINKLKQNESN